MKRNGVLGVGLLAAVGWVFQGCSGKSTSTSDAGGAGGTNAGATSTGGSGAVSGKGGKGGASGKSGSGGGSVGGASGSAGVAGVAGFGGGAGGTAGTIAGMGGSTGGVPSVGGAAGVGGSAGSAGFAFDDVCACEAVSPGLDDEVEFSCTITLEALAERLPTPSDCEHDYEFVTRTYCEGPTKYRFLEGYENDYRLEVDDAGHLTFGSASGYVGWVCGIEGEPVLGRVTAGTPSEYECFDECKICAPIEELDEAALPQCLSCTPGPSPDSVSLTLEEYCDAEACPTSLLDAEERFAKPCGAADPQTEDTTCGITILTRVVGGVSESYFFDQETGELVGILRHNGNYPDGPCHAEDYVIGDTSPGPCSAVTTCAICASSDVGGAAGAGGEAGAAGPSDIVRTCPPG